VGPATLIGSMDAFPDIDRRRLAELCRRYHVARLEVFGSRATGTARPESDVDLLVTFEEGFTPSFLSADGFAALSLALEELFGRRIDLLTRDTVESDRNPHFRDTVLGEAVPLYDAA